MARTALVVIAVIAACGGRPATPPPATGGEAGTVVAVVDGDSLRIDFDGRGPAELRLAGINAPEAGECWADESRAALERIAGERVSVHGDERDRFGRRLGTVFAGSIDVNLEMIRQGHAIALTEGGESAIAAEEVAVAARSGLWSPVACGPGTRIDVTVSEIVFDPPGPDAEDLDREYVVVTNQGPAADLTGWTLRDESSAHRFRFPDGFRLEAGATVVVRTGCGDDTPEELHWCADGPIWNNAGDMALLLDPAGTVVDRRRY